LGEDLMHSRDYSEDTSKIIDEEIDRILREQEERAMKLLKIHQKGLELVANALLDKETIDGNEVAALIDEGYGAPVYGPDSKKAKKLKQGSEVRGSEELSSSDVLDIDPMNE
ncbi:MAG: cell division protein FtsH, partial [Candidatus Marsarchaeota archaeon]|nr:cell division protein FtsH [Candidatus Marsarchaeota archaeon]